MPVRLLDYNTPRSAARIKRTGATGAWVARTIVRKEGLMMSHPWTVVIAALATGTALAAPNVVAKQCSNTHA